MVDITSCEVCGRTIPAIGQDCPYCQRDRGDRESAERPYLGLALRLLVYLFLADVVSTLVLAILTMVQNREESLGAAVILIAAAARLLLGAATLKAFFLREARARTLPLIFLAYEGLTAGAVLAGWFPIDRWSGGLVAPFWKLLFVVLFLRSDVKAYLDPGLADRRRLGELLREVERGQR